jgi:hypothetical protein
VVTGWTDAPVRWPIARPLGVRGGAGLLVTAELARAVRAESIEAMMRAFGVSQGTVSNWRRRFGSPSPRPRPRRPRPPTFQEEQTRRAKELGVAPQERWQRTGWTPEQLARLGTAPDAEVAAALGKTLGAVRWKRCRQRVPAFAAGPEHSRRGWAEQELDVLGTDHDEAIAVRLKRTAKAVGHKRRELGIAAFRDRRRKAGQP